MSKRDINYLKHIKHQIKQQERNDRYEFHNRELRRMTDLAQSVSADRENLHKERCKEAAVMSNYERLVNYAGTGDATYLGSECNWDLLERLGLKKKGAL